jgi:uncharacterized protein YuzE
MQVPIARWEYDRAALEMALGAAYIYLREGVGPETQRTYSGTITFDLDRDGEVVGIEVLF